MMCWPPVVEEGSLSMGARAWIGKVRGFAHGLLLVLIGLAAVSAAFGFVPTAAQNAVLTVAYVDGAVPLDPQASEWQQAPVLSVPLSGQMFLPPNGGGTVTGLSVRALANKTAVSILVEWADTTKDVELIRTEDFADAVAVQIVDAGGKTAPFVCMGQADFQTQIWQWRADRDPFAGGGLRLEDIYPNIYADWYPFQNESTFYPALYAGNVLMKQNVTPVQVLVSGGAGTIAPAGVATVYGAGAWSANSWKVTFSRKLQASSTSEIALRNDARFAISFAAWDGASGERDGMKSTSNWVDLAIQGPPKAFELGPFQALIFAGFVFMILIVLIALFRRGKKGAEAPQEWSGYTSEELREVLAPEKKEGTTRRAFLGLLAPGMAGAGLSLLSGPAKSLAKEATGPRPDDDSANWEQRRKKMMRDFEEGYRKPNHLR